MSFCFSSNTSRYLMLPAVFYQYFYLILFRCNLQIAAFHGGVLPLLWVLHYCHLLVLVNFYLSSISYFLHGSCSYQEAVQASSTLSTLITFQYTLYPYSCYSYSFHFFRHVLSFYFIFSAAHVLQILPSGNDHKPVGCFLIM